MVKDTTKYNFNGKSNLNKRNLAKEIIKKYISENSAIDYEKLKDIFNHKELGYKKTILNKIDYLAWKKDKKDTQNRYFLPITLGNQEIDIKNQWRVDNINLWSCISK
jgi:myo-inositol-1-phosphate synthase